MLLLGSNHFLIIIIIAKFMITIITIMPIIILIQFTL